MTNTIAIWLGVLLIGAALFDVYAQDGRMLVELGRRMIRLIDWLRFWA